MDEKKLLEIIEKLRSNQREWKTVDAKQTLILKENGDKAEFVKDVAAMANNFETSYLVIGLNDKTFSDVGALANHYTKNDINQILEGHIDPPVVVDYKEFSVNSNEYALIEIFGNNPPYIITRDIVHNVSDRKRVRIYKGTIFVRHEDRTEGISRSELEELLTKGLRIAFKDETEKAKKIAFDRPDYWEFLLTAELLSSKIGLIRKELVELERGMFFKKTRRVTGQEFINWSQSRLGDLTSLIQLLSKRFTEDFQLSWGKPGEPGDPVEIKRVADSVFLLCRELLEWEAEFRSVIPPDSFMPLRHMMEGWASQVISSIENIPAKLLEPFDHPIPEGKHTINIVFDAPSNINEITAELQRLAANPHEWIDDYK